MDPPALPTQAKPEDGGDGSASQSLAPSSGRHEKWPLEPPSPAADTSSPACQVSASGRFILRALLARIQLPALGQRLQGYPAWDYASTLPHALHTRRTLKELNATLWHSTSVRDVGIFE